MKHIYHLTLLLILILFWSSPIHAQVQETWVRTYSSTSTFIDDKIQAMFVDAAGNVFVSGHTVDGIVTIKYDKNGNTVWKKTYTSGREINDITVDGSGNVYLAGDASGNYLTIKYMANGDFAWAASYNAEDEDDRANAIAVDGNGNVYVTGSSETEFDFEESSPSDYTDIATVKYNSNGEQVWVRRYNGADPGLGFDAATAITIDAFDNIYVAGTSQLNGNRDIVTIKYNPAGTVLWIQRFNGPNNEHDGATDIQLDAAGNVIVVGTSRDESGPSFDLYRDAVIVKYTFSGFQLWSRQVFGNTTGGHHVGLDVDIDAAGNIILMGFTEIEAAGTQFITKYSSAGDKQWLKQSSGVSGRRSEVATDGTNIYTVGYSSGGITTIKFNSAGTQQWRKEYATGAADNDFFFIGLDGDQNVYTSGNYKTSNFSNSDYLTIRYSQCTLTCPGDITVNAETGKCGANVNYSPVTTTGSCGATITYSHASGSFFPVGTTSVTATSTETGATCSFNITVVDDQLPAFTLCPSGKTVNADAGVCYASAASVNGGTATATDNCTVTVTSSRSDGLLLTDNYPVGITTITWTASDGTNTVTCSQTITVVDNVPPVISNVSVNKSVLTPPNHKMTDVTVDYDVTDNCSNTVTVTVTSDEPETGLSNGDQGPDIVKIDDKHWQLRAERDGKGDGRVYTITITAVDGSGNTSTETRTVIVAHNITTPHSGAALRIGNTVNFSGSFWDVPGNKHTAQWLIDGKTIVKGTVTEPSGMKNGTVTGSYKFTSPGVYKLQMNITDQKGVTTHTNTNGDLEAIIVIYDPNGGYTYGGGYFTSPEGALKSSPTATGDVSFGFTMNYYKNATLPKGETQFEFKLGDFEYNAVNFDYLVISGAKAQFKGTGKLIGGQSGINFIMTVIDGQLDGSGTDKVRMKIYNKNTGEVYYDNQPGASDTDNPGTQVGTNSSIVISSNTAITLTTRLKSEEQIRIVPTSLEVNTYPNPTSSNFRLMVNSSNRIDKIKMQVIDVYGRVIETKTIASNQNITFGQLYRPGAYYLRIIQGKEQKQLKLIKLSD